MPMPVSLTEMTRSKRSPTGDAAASFTSMRPRSVNFTALPIRFTST